MSKRIPRFLVPDEMDGLYHVVSRVVGKAMAFGEEEKQKFRELAVGYAGFSGIQIVAWCLMDNHFHLLLMIPAKAGGKEGKLPINDILRRLRCIYSAGEVAEVKRILGLCKTEEERRKFLEPYTRRMGDLPMFMRSIKQRFSRWYNKQHKREGTLWEDRYKSVVIESEGTGTLDHAARVVAAYIDLNPVRAGMVEDPKDYSWCGYARAVVGEKECVKGITTLWGRGRGVKAALAEHRAFLFEEGSEEKTEDFDIEDRRHENGRTKRGKIQDPRTGEWKTRVGIDARKVWEERQRGGRLPLCILLRLRSRYLVDGAVIGRAEFVRRVTGGIATAPTTGKPGKKMRFGEWGGLHVLRDLRVDVVG